VLEKGGLPKMMSDVVDDDQVPSDDRAFTRVRSQPSPIAGSKKG
jgi:hypothetical protein